MLTTKLTSTGLRWSRSVYANGRWLGELTRRSEHYRGRTLNKRLVFEPAPQTGLRSMVEDGWTLSPILQRIEQALYATLQGGA